MVESSSLLLYALGEGLAGRRRWYRCAYVLSCFTCVRLFATLWTVAGQAPLSMGFFRQEYWSGLLCPPPGDLPDPGIELGSPSWQADSLPLSHLGNGEGNGTPLQYSCLENPMDGEAWWAAVYGVAQSCTLLK